MLLVFCRAGHLGQRLFLALHEHLDRFTLLLALKHTLLDVVFLLL
jgi:hypothetical protein